MKIGDRVQVGGMEYCRRGEVGTIVEFGEPVANSSTAKVKFREGVRQTIEFFVSDLRVVGIGDRVVIIDPCFITCGEEGTITAFYDDDSYEVVVLVDGHIDPAAYYWSEVAVLKSKISNSELWV